MTPADFLGEHRLIVACQKNWTTAQIDWPGFAERDVALFENLNGVTKRVSQDATGQVQRTALDRSGYFDALVDCTHKSEFVLIGKDGGVKKRWMRTLPLAELFQTIDAMPMRRSEMRR